MEQNTEFITELLDFLDPSRVTYEEWLKVGFALKEEGFGANVWDDWSRKDAERYHAGECEHKWATFAGSRSPVTGGTLFEIAKSYGFTPRVSHEIAWDGEIGAHDRAERVLPDVGWIEGREITEPAVWNPKDELMRYLSLFDSTENVGYVTETWEKDGRHMPTKGAWDRTAGELLSALAACSDIRDVIGDYNPDAGAWIRFNPLDGRGVKNENVTEFRYALVESDSTELEKQNAIIRELELPVAALVYSGGKSLHAIVRIDAGNYDEYRARVDYLYDVCKKNGLVVDAQNRNPSRLSRMPGVQRGGKKQFLVDMNIGKASFSEWKEWIESASDDLPDPEPLDGVWQNLPELAPCLIEGVLRQGHKMLVAGPSKAGKSFALIELCVAIAEGVEWLGFECARGRVLYINLELDRASCLHRFRDVYDALGVPAEHLSHIDIWNLRGKTLPLDKLAPKLIRRAAKKNYIAVILDPIYKIITGDENSAEQMSYFCNQFDKICAELGTAVIYCHHHSKGLQGGKRSMERASGSGVFSRDPDALIDLVELELPESVVKAENDRAVENVALRWLDEYAADWRDKILRDDLCSEDKALDACRSVLAPQVYKDMCAEMNAAKCAAQSRTAWRLEATLREFARPAPLNLWFDYPIHRMDTTGVLADIQLENAFGSPYKKNFAAKRTPEEARKDKQHSFDAAFEMLTTLSDKTETTVRELAEYLGTSEKTVRRRIGDSDKYYITNNSVGARHK